MLTIASSLFTVFLLVDFSSAAPTEKKSIWTISIFRDPAPSPEEGPPASANALRDPSKLKYEIVGIVCAYLFWLTLTAIGLVIVGARYRRRQQQSDRTLKMESIMKPTGRVTLREIEAGPKSPLGPLSPKSPGKMMSIKSWARSHRGQPSEVSLSTLNSRIDDRVVEADRARNMDDMAKLYAAVMVHDQERKSNRGHSSSDSSPVLEDNLPPTPRTPRTPRSPRSPQYPPQMAHPAYIPPVPEVYPQEYYEPMPHPPIAESDESSLLDNPTQKSKAMSITSMTSRIGSSHSNKKERSRPSAITVGGRVISKPLGSADLRQSAWNGSQASLQPSVYSPGPPPPTPGRVQKVEEIEMHGRAQPTGITSTDTVNTVNSNAKVLPFRQFYGESMKSAPPTKTTFVDRRQSVMNGPKTGVPKTPYSPYCPSTPMTPITPRRLLNKQEIKQNKKQYSLKVVAENDMVKGNEDMWGT
ncbi:hypothetical protein LTR05_004302 [Lithohypha guttulata]|uniref:Uncharacterized protein n=1 Tax=Lithohypha guttulata TaxID=1690604 RepID=A0AAN7T1D6_9EURO|nr:hypothetical protein LTR05_004302 [Lithohypha guttulata]